MLARQILDMMRESYKLPRELEQRINKVIRPDRIPDKYFRQIEKEVRKARSQDDLEFIVWNTLVSYLIDSGFDYGDVQRISLVNWKEELPKLSAVYQAFYSYAYDLFSGLKSGG